MTVALPCLYVGWDEHMMFSAPLAVTIDLQTPFAQVVSNYLPRWYGEHPEFQRIDWARVQWFQGERMFTPSSNQSLSEHGFKPRSVLRFRTPGLEGLKGSCG
jgi:phenol/toluene 2-monooxygenase (NADH) P4/A4